MSNIHGISHSSGRLLHGIRSFINSIIRINPPRRDGIHPCLSGQAHRHSMCQSGNAAFCCCIAFRLRLAHSVSGRRDIDNGRPFSQMLLKQLCQIKRRCNSHGKSLLKLLIGAFRQPLHQRRGIIDQHIHMAKHIQNFCGKCFQYLFSADITHVMRPFCLINHSHLCAFFRKRFCNGLPDPMCTACNHYNLILKFSLHPYLPFSHRQPADHLMPFFAAPFRS